MILDIIIVVLMVSAVALIADTIMEVRNRNNSKISFKESMDLTGLPVITFRQGENKLNFVLDTGAVSSVIDSNILNTLEYTPIEGTSTGYGIDGKEHVMERVGIVLTYKDNQYSDVFRVFDMTASFGAFKRDFGVTVHGLLSSSFFERYKYVLDFKELIAYCK